MKARHYGGRRGIAVDARARARRAVDTGTRWSMDGAYTTCQFMIGEAYGRGAAAEEREQR